MSEFLAEASVLISPDLTAFRAKLIAELEAHTKGVVATVGVAAKQATTAASVASATGAAQVAGVTARQGAAIKALTAEEKALVEVERLRAAGLRSIQLESKRALAIDNDVSRARNALRGASDRVLIAEQGIGAARRTGNIDTFRAARTELELARAREQEALSTFKASTAEKVLTAERGKGAATAAARTSAITRGVGVQAASFAGLRGAVLGANPAFIAGAAGAIAFSKAVKSATDLESELNVFAVTTGATADQMKRVSEEAQRLGADLTLPGVTAGEAASAFTELGKAGLSVEDSLSGARGVLQLATAAQIDNATATQFAAAALNAFSLGGEQAVHVADVLTNAANASQGSISDIGIAFQQAAAAARLVGVSFEDTIALLTLLQKNGIRGSDAGTSLRVSFTRLINPTAKARAILEDLNIQLRDAQGNLRPESFIEFARAQENLSKAQQQANAAIVFGTDGLRAYSIISREGLGGLGLVREELDRQGSAAELAGARMAGLAGKMENLKNQLEALGVTLGQVTTGPLGAFVTGMTESVSGVNDLAQGLVGLGREAKSAFDQLNDVATVNIGGVDIGPASGIKTFFETVFAPLPSRIKLIKAFSDGFGESENNIKVARFALRDMVTELNEFGGPGRLKQAIDDFKALRAELQKGDEKAQRFATDLDPFIKKLESIPPGQTFALDIKIPPNILTGEPGEKVGRASAAKFATSLVDELQAQSDRIAAGFAGVLSGRQGEGGAVEHAAEFGRDVANAFVSATTSALSGLDLAVAQARGNQGAEISILTAREARQEAFLNDLLKRKPTAKNVALAEKAAQNLKQTRDAITTIQDQTVADAKSAAAETERKADEAKEARSKADQAFLDALQPRRDEIGRQAQRAAGTPGLQDNVNAARALRQRLLKEIEIITASNIDAKTKAAQIRQRADELIKVRQDITRARNDLREAREQIAEDRAAERTSLLEARLGLAEARGDEGAQVRAIDALIKDVQKQINKTKQGTTAFVQLQIEKQNLINKRREVLEQDEEAAKEGRGTAAFDLLQQAAATFNANAGNLIGGNQPFAGPTGFTADLAQFLRRQQGGAAVQPVDVRFPGKAADDKIVRSQDGLAVALDQLRLTIEAQGGNQSTSGLTNNPNLHNDHRFYESRVTRSQVDSRTGGGV